MNRKRPDRNLVMAPSHSETGAMVYLANCNPRRGIRGVVVCKQTDITLRFPPNNAVFELSLETAFAFLPAGTTHLKSFPSEKTKRGHYV